MKLKCTTEIIRAIPTTSFSLAKSVSFSTTRPLTPPAGHSRSKQQPKKRRQWWKKKNPFLVTRCLPFLFRSNEVGTVTPSTHGSLPTTSTRCFWSAASGRMWSWLGVGGHAQDDKSLNLYKGQSGCDGRFRQSGLGLTQFRAKVSVAVNLLCVFIFSFPKSIRCWAFTPVSVASRLQHISQTLMF